MFWQRGYCNIVVPCRKLGVFLNRNHKTQEIIQGFSCKIRKLLCTLGLTEKISHKGYGEVMSSLGHPCHTASLISFLWGESFIQVSLEDCPNCKVDLLFFQNFSAKCRREVTFTFTLRICSIISQSLFGFSSQGLSTTVGKRIDLSREIHEKCSEKDVEDITWYRILQGGGKEKIAHCSPSRVSCLLINCTRSCPEYLRRLKTNGLSVILTNVTPNDRGLKFQCELHPGIHGTRQAYTIKIKEVAVPREG